MYIPGHSTKTDHRLKTEIEKVGWKILLQSWAELREKISEILVVSPFAVNKF
jgi:hypothetical protein